MEFRFRSQVESRTEDLALAILRNHKYEHGANLTNAGGGTVLRHRRGDNVPVAVTIHSGSPQEPNLLNDMLVWSFVGELEQRLIGTRRAAPTRLIVAT